MSGFFFKRFHKLRCKYARVFGYDPDAKGNTSTSSEEDESINRWGWQLVIFRICGWNLAQEREILNMNCQDFLNRLSMELEIEDYKESIQKKQQNRLH
jgi:hypothetical protein